LFTSVTIDWEHVKDKQASLSVQPTAI